MTKNITSITSNESNSTCDGLVGFTAGYATYKGVNKFIRRPYGRFLLDELNNFSQNENDIFWNAAQQAYTNSGLRGKSVDIIAIDSQNSGRVITNTLNTVKRKLDTRNNVIEQKLLGWDGKPRPKIIRYIFGDSQPEKLKKTFEQIANGNNACYYGMTKSVYVNKDKMAFSTFHEMGHAINNTSKGIKKFLSKTRHACALFAPIVVFIGLLTNEKNKKNGEKESTIHKINSFIKRNCGILTFGLMLPTVIEEGLASINGAKLAKDVLSPEMLKKLNKTNAKAFGSYAIAATVMGLCAQLAVYVKDKIINSKSSK